MEPTSAVVLPEQTLELIVTAFLDDCLQFSDKLNILITRGVNFTVFLRAKGRGSTVVSEPPIQPCVNLGTFFSGGPCEREFVFTNKGRRMQALSWVTDGFSASKVKKLEMDRKSRDLDDIRLKKNDFTLKDLADATTKRQFKIIPEKFVLEPKQSCVVTLKGFCKQ